MSDPFEKPMMDVKVRDLRPWLAHYKGQYFSMFTDYLQRSYCKGPAITHGATPFLALIVGAAGLGYWRASKKAEADGIFVGSGTPFEPEGH
uniref:Uncharacterized protein n=1 Tax=Paramoeba aestuarina TaxID=180227 RepID=A0A7S4PAA9_9EUKA|eukprot:CAMPEP_0201519606 /NCGR_PEP_ID=MMETSP0161_2-20130828/10114_1 /ASSEMBLY_ACC=CAM_ASM_000251 /TAXON_ID=180227 /ORGANISM="Neoparamoeba aestuarina, Strain SoJaBio B1-5/56/2" /LENGTH=90 /DNA_ID=CAMNT_0047917695 /DNA_START=250 /DNA_END=522 /DNA_ORIENTATION=+